MFFQTYLLYIQCNLNQSTDAVLFYFLMEINKFFLEFMLKESRKKSHRKVKLQYKAYVIRNKDFSKRNSQ